jgi:uncharacterized repeat protein (TIGR03847 family)
MAAEYNMDQVDFITVDTIGPPGQRVFHLQAGQGDQLLTLTVEKEQAAALAESISSLLGEIADRYNHTTPEPVLRQFDLDLREPILPAFRVAQMGLGYDSDTDQIVLIVNELLPEEAGDDASIARLSATREQMSALAIHTRDVVKGGRPICGNCGRPMDPEGHFCPNSNGHRKPVQWG